MGTGDGYDNKLLYGWALIRSRYDDDVRSGVYILKGPNTFSHIHIIYIDLFKICPQNLRRDCLFFLSIGHMKMADYAQAKYTCDQLIAIEPENGQAISLREEISRKASKGFLSFWEAEL